MYGDLNTIVEKIRALTSEQRSEVEHFVEFIRIREQDGLMARTAAAASESAFAAVWNNTEDDVYNAL